MPSRVDPGGEVGCQIIPPASAAFIRTDACHIAERSVAVPCPYPALVARRIKSREQGQARVEPQRNERSFVPGLADGSESNLTHAPDIHGLAWTTAFTVPIRS